MGIVLVTLEWESFWNMGIVLVTPTYLLSGNQNHAVRSEFEMSAKISFVHHLKLRLIRRFGVLMIFV